MPKPTGMDACRHGMDPAWCYLCHVEEIATDPVTAWCQDVVDVTDRPSESRRGPMTPSQAGYLRFLCDEFGETFDEGLTEGEADLVIGSFMGESMTARQARTLEWLCRRADDPFQPELTYGAARARIRRLVALRGLRSA